MTNKKATELADTKTVTTGKMLSVDDCLTLLTIASRYPANSERLKEDVFNLTNISSRDYVDYYDEIKKAFFITAMAKAFGIGKEPCDYIPTLLKK